MRELDRVKSQFLANMSHELRTPLNSVIGFSRVILKGIDGPINETQEQDITAIYNSGMHLLNMINEILDLSKIEAGKMELQFDDVNISDVINSAVSTAAGLVKDKPIELIQKVPATLPTVQADEIRLSQVLINLISNAVKFTEKGSITVEATLQNNVRTNLRFWLP
jgi:signal transduction histidine kinase